MISTYNAYAAVHIDGVINIPSIQCGILTGFNGQENLIATFRVSAGAQCHTINAVGIVAKRVFAYQKVAKEQEIKKIQVNLRANVISSENVATFVSDGDKDIDWHCSSEVRLAADAIFEDMVAKKAGSIPLDWPSTPMLLPIPKPTFAEKCGTRSH